jgi:hypothetical protein
MMQQQTCRVFRGVQARKTCRVFRGVQARKASNNVHYKDHVLALAIVHSSSDG